MHNRNEKMRIIWSIFSLCNKAVNVLTVYLITRKWKVLVRANPCESVYIARLSRQSRRSGFLITPGTPINFHHVP